VPADWASCGQTFRVTADHIAATEGTELAGNAYTFRAAAPGYISGTITVGNTITQATTGATGTVQAVLNTTNGSGPDDWVQILWDGISDPFDYTGSYLCTDTTAGGTFTPAYRCRWDIDSLVWRPDTGTWRDDEIIPYTASDLGLAEWGISDWSSEIYDNAYVATIYRDVASMTYTGLAMAIVCLPGGEQAFSDSTFLDYAARWQTWGPGAGLSRSIDSWHSNLWDAYYATYRGMGRRRVINVNN